MAAYTIVPIEHNIKQAITAAVKAVEFKKYNVEPDEVVDSLLADIFRSLFPNNPGLVNVDKVEVQIPIVPAAEAVALPASPKPEKTKKAKAKKEPVVEEAAPANAAAGSASAPPEKEKKPKAKKEKDAVVHLDKLNPTQKKALKKVSEDIDAKEFLVYVNGLSEEDYRGKTFEEHAQAFVKSKVAPAEIVERECIEVQFKGQTYFVEPASKKVYKQDGEVDRFVGHVGMLEFEGMVVPA